MRQAGHQNPLQDWTLLLGETLFLKGTWAGQVNKWKQAVKNFNNCSNKMSLFPSFATT